MVVERDPLFFVCAQDAHQGYNQHTDYALVDFEGKPILRQDEQMIGEFTGDLMMLRYPEQIWLVDHTKYQNWEIYITSNRVILVKDLEFPGNFEFFDHIDNYGRLVILHPTEEIDVDDFFDMLGKGKRKIRDFRLVFQIAVSRISSIMLSKSPLNQVECVDFWYQDSEDWNNQTQIQLFPRQLEPGQILQVGIKLQQIALREKLLLLDQKHKTDPGWEAENFQTYVAALKRLVVKPDFLAMGSAKITEDTANPIILQPHSLVWNQDAFASTYDGEGDPKVLDLSY